MFYICNICMLHSCMYVMYVCIYACMYVCIYVCMYLCNVCMYIMYARNVMYVCMYVMFVLDALYPEGRSDRSPSERAVSGENGNCLIVLMPQDIKQIR